MAIVLLKINIVCRQKKMLVVSIMIRYANDYFKNTGFYLTFSVKCLCAPASLYTANRAERFFLSKLVFSVNKINVSILFCEISFGFHGNYYIEIL